MAIIRASFSEVSVVIQISPPTINGTTISPTSPNDSDLLTCTAISADDDAETLVETITWTNLSSGAVLGTGASLQLSPNSAADGDVIQCTFEVRRLGCFSVHNGLRYGAEHGSGVHL